MKSILIPLVLMLAASAFAATSKDVAVFDAGAARRVIAAPARIGGSAPFAGAR